MVHDGYKKHGTTQWPTFPRRFRLVMRLLMGCETRGMFAGRDLGHDDDPRLRADRRRTEHHQARQQET